MRRLTALDATATSLGLFVGQKAADASALAPGLVVADAEPGADRAALVALADWCCRFSPAVAIDAPDGLVSRFFGTAQVGSAAVGPPLGIGFPAQRSLLRPLRLRECAVRCIPGFFRLHCCALALLQCLLPRLQLFTPCRDLDFAA